ncbi:hypothetical protein M1583_00495, partial [Candidatus Marsarchaeota archaeon]|nr:hypothetical protein [Candidatus Marsarchaeota archaeon]
MATLDRIPSSVVVRVPIFEAETPMTKVISAVYKNPAVIINKGNDFYGLVDFRSVHRESISLKLNKNSPAVKYA